MVNLQFDKSQTHYCEVCNSWLEFCFDKHTINFEGINICLSNIPLLRCDKCIQYYFPEKTKALILSVYDKTKEEGKPKVVVSPKQDFTRNFNYGQVRFLYDYRDYENIPGLQTDLDDGFLTPVFFNLAVFNKYSQYPDYRLDLFSQTYGSIKNKDEFSISFGINRNKKVIMWLGDIDKLPLNEQHYLRSENIESDHDLFSEFYESQMEIQFSNPSPENALFHARSEMIKLCYRKRKGYLYTFEGEISKILENLDRPVFWQEKHVNPVIESLNRVMIESLDENFFRKELDNLVESDKLKKYKSLKLFEKWLEKVLEISDFSNVTLPFFVLYDFRIVSTHLMPDCSKTKKIISINKRLNLPGKNKNYELIYDLLIDKLRESYEIISQQLQSLQEEFE